MPDSPAFGHEPLTESEQRKARRKEQVQAERAGARELHALTDAAVDIALQFAPEVAAALNRSSSERAIDVAFPTLDAAKHARKRINDALSVAEWQNDVDVWVWQFDTHVRPPLTDHGRESGYELRLEQTGRL